jgi:TRAP-type C4-dicarboxylate transport system permease small subunit
VNGLLRGFRLLEDGLLLALLAAMIALASGQIVLRNLFDLGFVWIDPLLRILVLWCGLIGAMVASRDNRHIRIDLLTHLLAKRARLGIQIFIGLFTVAVCAVIAWYGAQWVRLDFADGLTGQIGLPAWLPESIIPFAFAVIALRYLAHSWAWTRLWLDPNAQWDDAS